MSRAVIVVLAIVFCVANGAKILAIIPTVSYSHQIAFRPLWKELSARGHQITLVTTDPMNDTSLTNVKEISWSNIYYLPNEKYPVTEYLYQDTSKYLNYFNFISYLLRLSDEVYSMEMNNGHIQNLLNNETEHFDLLMAEIHQPFLFSFAYRFNCSYIGLSSLDASPRAYYLTGNPSNPIAYPDMMTAIGKSENFLDRLLTVFFSAFTHVLQIVLGPLGDQVVAQYFGEGYPSLEHMLANMDMLFVTVNPVFYYRATLPNVVNIGGGSHLNPEKPLPQDLKQFLDDATEGCVYFSFGSNIKSKDIPTELRQIIIEALSELPFRVVWKFENDDLPGKPKNVMIKKWVPQQDVLRHKNIKAFVTQGGIQSTEEAIFSHVPLVVIPFMGDQDHNARMVETYEYGVALDHRYLTKESLKAAILEVANNPKYKARVKRIAEIAADQPMTGLEKAVWWTEYVIRHKGAKHLRSPGADIPLYQYLLLDVIGVVLLALILVIGIIYILMKLVVGLCKALLRTVWKVFKPKRE